MILLFAASVAAAQPAPPPDDCPGTSDCVTASAAQMFALADRLFEDGDKAGAADILRAITEDKHPELRAEAHFRLAAVLESLGDLDGAARALRGLLAEQPDANRARLELARILQLQGKPAEAKAEVGRAEAIGLPPEVQGNVRRFASRLATSKKRGLVLEVTGGPDSNINRATGSQFIDTIIAPFELDEDARRIAGFGTTGVARFYSRDQLGGVTLLSRVNGRADLYDKSRFNDLQLGADSGPEFVFGKIRLRPALTAERRWYGGSLYSSGHGGELSLLTPLSPRAQAEFRVSRVRQDIAPNRGQDGWRTTIDFSLTYVVGPRTTAQLSVQHGRVDARFRPESVRLVGGALALAHQGRTATLFGEAGVAAAHGIEPLFLFGETRRDRRIDLAAGAIFTRASIAGFSPLVRVSHSRSKADIVLWDYKRTRLDIGITRNF